MGTASLLAGALIGALAAAAFFAVAGEIRRRPVSARSRLGLELLRGWWLAVGAYALLVGTSFHLMAAAGLEDARIYAMVRSVAVLVLLVGLWALTSHFIFLFTGGHRALVPLGIVYAGVYALVTFVYASLEPTGIVVGEWIVDVRYDPPPDGRLLAVILVLFGLPQVLAAIAYLLLARRMEDPQARLRARLVAVSLMVWCGSALVANFSDSETFRFLTRPILGLGAAGVVFFAYRQPAWLTRRLAAQEAAR